MSRITKTILNVVALTLALSALLVSLSLLIKAVDKLVAPAQSVQYVLPEPNTTELTRFTF